MVSNEHVGSLRNVPMKQRSGTVTEKNGTSHRGGAKFVEK
jgi:hypothetical protein